MSTTSKSASPTIDQAVSSTAKPSNPVPVGVDARQIPAQPQPVAKGKVQLNEGLRKAVDAAAGQPASQGGIEGGRRVVKMKGGEEEILNSSGDPGDAAAGADGEQVALQDGYIMLAQAEVGAAAGGQAAGAAGGAASTTGAAAAAAAAGASGAATAGAAVSAGMIAVGAAAIAVGVIAVSVVASDETVNTTAPNAPAGLDLAAADDSGSSDSDNITGTTSGLTISGTAEAGSTVRIYDTDGTTLLGTGTATNGNFAIDVSLAAGSHTLTAKATDAAGNAGVASAGLSITVDTTANAPGVALATDSGGSNTDLLSNVGTLSLTGIEAGATAQYSIDGGTTWTNTFTAAEGANTVRVRQTDAAGNVSPASTALTFTLDTAAPAIQSMTAQGSTVTLTYDGALDAANIPVAGNFSVTVNDVVNVVTNVAVAGSTVTLTLTNAIATGANVIVAYTDPTVGNDAAAIQDAAGNDAVSFSTGVVADGYVRGAQIYIDSNGNGTPDTDEILVGVVTDSNGNFILPDGSPTGTIIATGGINIDTGVLNTIVLKAPTGSSMISPLTTLVQEYVETNSTTTAAASAAVVAALGLATGTDLTSYDPLAALAADPNDATALAVQIATAQVATIVILAAENPTDGSDSTDAAATVIDNLVTQITTATAGSTTIDLTDDTVITAALDEASTTSVDTITTATTDIADATTLTEVSAAQAIATDTIDPAAPTAIVLTAASDSGVSSTDNLTNDTTPTVRVSFNATANDGTAVVADDTVTVLSGATEVGEVTLTSTNIANGYVEVTASALTPDGVHNLTAVLRDIAGNESAASAALAVTLDTTAPIVIITDDETGTGNIAGGDITYTFTFSEAVTGFTADDITVANGAKGTFTAVSATEYTLAVTPTAGFEGNVTVDVAADKAVDLANNANTAATQSVQTVDMKAPTVAITDDETGTGNIAGGDITYTFTFSEAVTGFTADDITVANGSKGTFTAVSATEYTLAVTPNVGFEGNVTVDVAADKAADLANNANTAATQSVQTVDMKAPTVTTTALSMPENSTAGVALAADDTVTWGLGTGDDTGLFALSGNSLSLLQAKNYESDAQAYTVNVTATDGVGNVTNQAITVNLTDVNEAPFVQEGVEASITLVNGQPLDIDASFAEDFGDPEGDALTFTLAAGSLPQGLSLNADGTVTGTPTTDGEYTFTVQASDAQFSATQQYTATVVSAPVVQSFTVADASGTPSVGEVGDALTFLVTFSEEVTVAGGIPEITFSMGGNPVVATYVSGSGGSTLTFTGIAPAGDGTSVSLTAIDLKGATVTGDSSLQGWVTTATEQTAAYTLDNSDPEFTSAGAVNFAENGAGTAYATATTDATAITYSMGGADAALFDISSSTGAVTFKASPNFEAPADAGLDNIYNITVTATDVLGHATIQSVAITVTNVNEAPSLTSGATANFAENGTGTVYTATATDPDASAALTYALGGTDAARFAINADTGAVTFAAAPNFEAPTDADVNNVYNITVAASDGTNTTAAQAVAISVTNVNEAPTISSGTAVNFAENGTGIAYTTVATDPDASTTLAYSLTGTDAGLFNINSGTGAVTFKIAPNYEAPADSGTNNVYNVTVTASDGNLSDSEGVAISVTNVNEAPISSPSTSTATLVVNQEVTDNISDLFSDVDAGDILTYTATGLPTTMSLDSSGNLSGTPTETVTDQVVVFTATDLGGLSATHTATVDVVAAPTVSSSIDNVANFDVTSNIVLTASENVTAVADKYVHIINDGGTGFHGENTINTQDILVTDTSMVTIVNNTITINPQYDLDLANNYHIMVDAGAFTANEVDSVATVDALAMNFSTVTPGTAGGGVAGAVASQMMASGTDAMAASYSWWDVETLGSTISTAVNGDLVAGNIAVVFKDYDPLAGDANSGYTGIGSPGDDYVNLLNFGNGDLLYIDNQTNAAPNDLTQAAFIHSGTAPVQLQFDGYASQGGFPIWVDITTTEGTTAFDSVEALKLLISTTYNPILSA